jgi:hypothetical protein
LISPPLFSCLGLYIHTFAPFFLVSLSPSVDPEEMEKMQAQMQENQQQGLGGLLGGASGADVDSDDD